MSKKKIANIVSIIEQTGAFVITDPYFLDENNLAANITIFLKNISAWMEENKPNFKKNILIIDHPRGVAVTFQQPTERKRGVSE